MTNPHNPDLPYFPCAPTDAGFFDAAPVKNRYTVTLPVSPQRLFEIFEDPASWPRWAPGIGRVEWTSPRPYGVGTTRTVTFWGGMEVYEEFVRWAPGEEMAFVFRGITQEVWRRFGERYEVELDPPLHFRCVSVVLPTPSSPGDARVDQHANGEQGEADHRAGDRQPERAGEDFACELAGEEEGEGADHGAIVGARRAQARVAMLGLASPSPRFTGRGMG